MSRDRAQTHEENSLFPGIIMNAPEKKHQDQIRSKTIRVMLRLVMALLTTVFFGCYAYILTLLYDYVPVDCNPYPITLLADECKTVEPLERAGCSNCLCEVSDVDEMILDTRTKLWLINPTLPGIYIRNNREICATADVSEYDANIAHYGVNGIDQTSDYFGDGDFIITSSGSGALRVTAYAEPDEIPFSSSTRLYANIGGGTGPDFTFSWIPVDALDDPNARNPHASPTTATDYTVTVTDSSGTVVSGSVHVTVTGAPPPALVVTVTVLPTVIPPGGQADLSVVVAGGVQPYTFNWTPADGLDTVDLNNPSPTVHPAASVAYEVTVIDANGDWGVGSAFLEVASGGPLLPCYTVDPNPPTLDDEEEQWDASCSTGTGLQYRWVFSCPYETPCTECFGADAVINPDGTVTPDPSDCDNVTFHPDLHTLPYQLGSPQFYHQVTLTVKDSTGATDSITNIYSL